MTGIAYGKIGSFGFIMSEGERIGVVCLLEFSKLNVTLTADS